MTSGEIAWERYVETDKEAEENQWKISLEYVKREEWSNYDQNYLWIPLTKGQTVCKEEWVQYTQEQVNFDYIQIWVDPAFSTKTGTDAIGIVVTWFKKIKDVLYKYVITWKKLEWEKKDTHIAINIIQSLYNKYWVSRVIVESNNGWGTFARLLQDKSMAVDVVSVTKDKLTRFKEREWELMRHEVLFYHEAECIVEQLLEFTGDGWWEDDLVYWFLHSITNQSKQFYVL